MNDHSHLPRREVLGMAVASGLTLLTAPLRSVAQQVTRRTPAQILGPYYPVIKPTDQDTDLTMIAGRTGRAQGQVIYVAGRVINRHGKPVSGAQMEIWQANSHGRYTHQSDQHDAPLDPNFEGYARIVTDADGRYRIKTIKPGAYPDDSGTLRAPHIHFEVTGPRESTRNAAVLCRRASQRQGPLPRPRGRQPGTLDRRSECSTGRRRESVDCELGCRATRRLNDSARRSTRR